MAIETVTSENLAEFTAERLGLSEPADTSAPESTPEVVDEPVVEQRPKRDFRGRFSEVTEQRDKAEARAAEKEAEAAAKAAEAAKLADETKAERERRLLAESERDALRAKYEPPKSDELGPEPVLEQFENPTEYAQALKEWTREATLKEDRERRESEQVATSWNDRLKATKATISDFDEIVGASKAQVPDQIKDEIVRSEVGPQILYHLAQNPDEAAKFATLSAGAQLKAFAKLEVKFEAPKTEQTKVSDVAKGSAPEISRAPAPISPVKGSSIPDVRVDAKGEYKGTYQQWKADRRAGRV